MNPTELNSQPTLQAFFLRVFLGCAAVDLAVAALAVEVLAVATRRGVGLAINSAGCSRLADFHKRSRS
jgi:hypothetical protein